MHLMTLLVWGCASPPEVDPSVCVATSSPPAGIEGTWAGDLSSANYRFRVEGGQLCMDAWDASDGERFTLRNLRVEGGSVQVTTHMPSTEWTDENTFTPKDEEVHQVWQGQLPGEGTLVKSASKPLD